MDPLCGHFIFTLRSDECKNLINDARIFRSKNDEENNDELIEIHLEFMKNLRKPQFFLKIMRVPDELI